MMRPFFIAMALVLLHATSEAAITRFESRVDQTRVSVGDRIKFTIEIESNNGMPRVNPTQPDFGGLKFERSPPPSQQTTIINFASTYKRVFTYYLTASTVGIHEIGSSQIEVDGRILRTRPITIQVDAQNMTGLPPSLQSEPILYPHSNDRGINEQLKGRLFIRPVISDANPYVREPIILSYYLYVDRLRVTPTGMTPPDLEGMLVGVIHQAERLNAVDQIVDGRHYDVALFYQAVLTPTRPGEFTLDGYRLNVQIPLQSPRSSRSVFDSFFDDPLFGNNRIAVEVTGGALKLNVRPLPEAGSSGEFSGTVGAFKLRSAIDQDSATQDDIITLTLTLEGKGNAEVASVPAFTETEDFELFSDPLVETQWTNYSERLSLKKIEYMLRPKRTGTLSIPAVHLEIFDPEAERYRKLDTPQYQVEISRGASSSLAGSAGEDGSLDDLEKTLRYIKVLGEVRMMPPRPLGGTVLYWSLQIGAVAAAGLCFARTRLRESRDPAEARKGGAWIELERKLKKVRELAGGGETEPPATLLEQGLREFIADWFGLSVDGLTSEEISRLLRQAGIDPESVDRLGEILVSCAQFRYAPAGASDADFAAWASESRSILDQRLR